MDKYVVIAENQELKMQMSKLLENLENIKTNNDIFGALVEEQLFKQT